MEKPRYVDPSPASSRFSIWILPSLIDTVVKEISRGIDRYLALLIAWGPRYMARGFSRIGWDGMGLDGKKTDGLG